MRIDLLNGGTRPWLLRWVLSFLWRKLDSIPGPQQVFSYRPELVSGQFIRYIFRGMSGRGAWSQAESELIATFVSKLNRCHF